MTGWELINNLVGELEAAREMFINLNMEDDTNVSMWLDDIRRDIERLYDYGDGFKTLTEDIIIDE